MGSRYGGRLTLIAGQPYMQSASDISNTTLWYSPYYKAGCFTVPIFDVTDTLQDVPFTSGPLDDNGLELSCGAKWAPGTSRDVFVTMGTSGNPPQLFTGPAWSAPDLVSRGIMLYDNIFVNAGTITGDTGPNAGDTITVLMYQATWLGCINVAPATSSAPQVIGSQNETLSNVTSFSFQTTAPILAGDLLVLGCALSTNGAAAASAVRVSDGTNTVMFVEGDTTGVLGTNEGTEWYAPNSVAFAAGATVTVQLNQNSGPRFNGFGTFLLRIPGALATPFDAANAAGSMSAASVTATIATPAAGAKLVVGVTISDTSGSYLGAPGFTTIAQEAVVDGNGILAVDWMLTSAQTPINYAPAFSAASRMGAVVVDFLVTSSGGGVLAATFTPGQNRRCDVWNAHNQEQIVLNACPITPPGVIMKWSPISLYTDHYTPFGNDPNNRAYVFTGLPLPIDCRYAQTAYLADQSSAGGVACVIGWNGIPVGTEFAADFDTTGQDNGSTGNAFYTAIGSIGQNVVDMRVGGANTYSNVTLWGGYNVPSLGTVDRNCSLVAKYMG